MTTTFLPGHPFLRYENKALHLEGVRLLDLARRYGTPLYVYSRAAMLDALAAYQRGFAGRKARICYAMKANSSLAVLQLFARAGCGFDIVSAASSLACWPQAATRPRWSFPALARRARKCARPWVSA